MTFVDTALTRTALGRAKDAKCSINGRAHRYTRSEILNPAQVILICECGDVQWKDKPQDKSALDGHCAGCMVGRETERIPDECRGIGK